MCDNIHVAIRMRPLLPREIEDDATVHWEVKGPTSISQNPPSSVSFCFDHVFDGLESNEAVYEKLCSPIVESVMKGFNGTIFAYGQTSSGKTFTMMGEKESNMLGVIHYTISDIFNMIQNMPEREFLLRVSFMEIYNETVVDLLSVETRNLKVQEDKYGYIKVNGLQEHIIQNSDQVLQLMVKGEKKRRTGETMMNQRSSRSHSIFRMIIESRERCLEDAAVIVSQLNLVDLAGSERTAQSKTSGERFKEGVHINKSLLMLSHVISQLSEREDQYINYRDSKLTRLLQNSLGGNARTAIICTITPVSLEETHSTLKFATRAKCIKNKPQVNEIITEQALLTRYANEIKKLSEELEASKEQGKELEEKTKQNENLKRQIEELKAKFVSQVVPERKSKAVRRETWGGHLDANKLRLSFPTPAKRPLMSYSDLPTLEEETDYEQDKIDITRRSSVSKVASTGFPDLFNSIINSSKMLDVQVQTDEASTPPKYREEKASWMSWISSLSNELAELREYTTWEKQKIKAENELSEECEELKKENALLKEHLKISSSPLLSKNTKALEDISGFLDCSNQEIYETEEKRKSVFTKEISDDSISEMKSEAYKKLNYFMSSSQCDDHPSSISKCISQSGEVSFDKNNDKPKLNVTLGHYELNEKNSINKLEKKIKQYLETISSLMYENDLKDKQILLLKDKLQIKDQMISSLKDEITLKKTLPGSFESAKNIHVASCSLQFTSSSSQTECSITDAENLEALNFEKPENDIFFKKSEPGAICCKCYNDVGASQISLNASLPTACQIVNSGSMYLNAIEMKDDYQVEDMKGSPTQSTSLETCRTQAIDFKDGTVAKCNCCQTGNTYICQGIPMKNSPMETCETKNDNFTDFAESKAHHITNIGSEIHGTNQINDICYHTEDMNPSIKNYTISETSQTESADFKCSTPLAVKDSCNQTEVCYVFQENPLKDTHLEPYQIENCNKNNFKIKEVENVFCQTENINITGRRSSAPSMYSQNCLLESVGIIELGVMAKQDDYLSTEYSNSIKKTSQGYFEKNLLIKDYQNSTLSRHITTTETENRFCQTANTCCTCFTFEIKDGYCQTDNITANEENVSCTNVYQIENDCCSKLKRSQEKGEIYQTEEFDTSQNLSFSGLSKCKTGISGEGDILKNSLIPSEEIFPVSDSSDPGLTLNVTEFLSHSKGQQTHALKADETLFNVNRAKELTEHNFTEQNSVPEEKNSFLFVNQSNYAKNLLTSLTDHALHSDSNTEFELSDRNLIENDFFKLQNTQLEIFINDLHESVLFTYDIINEFMKKEYLLGINTSSFDLVKSCPPGDIIKHEISTLKELLTRIKLCISNRNETYEFLTDRLKSNIRECLLINQQLADLKIALNEKDNELSRLNEQLFDLKQNTFTLISLCQTFRCISSQNDFQCENNLKYESLMTQNCSSLQSIEVLLQMISEIKCYVNEKNSTFQNLNDNLEKANEEIISLQKNSEYIKNICETNCIQHKSISNFSKSVQTDDDYDEILASHIRLQEHNTSQEKIISKLKEEVKLLNMEIEESKKLKGTLQQDFENSVMLYKSALDDLTAKYESDKISWNLKTSLLVKKLEEKYDQEMNDQENKFNEDLNSKLFEFKQEQMKRDQEFRLQINEVKSQYMKETSALKQEYEIIINDLEIKLTDEATEKKNMKAEFERSKNDEISTLKMKYEKIINAYKNVQRQYKDQNVCLRLELKENIEKCDELKKKVLNLDTYESSNPSLLQDKLNKVTNERDTILKKYTKLKQQMIEHKAELNMKEEKLHEEEEMKEKLYKNNLKAADESIKKLHFELDQKKAKIISLETNNASMLKEIKKLKELLSSKTSSATFQNKNSQKSPKCDFAVNLENSTEKTRKKPSLDQNVDSEKAFEHPPLLRNECPSDISEEFLKNQKMANGQTISGAPNEKMYSADEVALLLGGGSGPANMVKTYWLEGKLYKRDSEIHRLKKEIAELKAIKHQHIKKENFVDLDEKRSCMKIPLHKFEENDENLTVVTASMHPYPHGAVPKVLPKKILKDKNDANPLSQQMNVLTEKHHPTMEQMKASTGVNQLPMNIQKTEPVKDGDAAFDRIFKILSSETDSEPQCKQQ